MPNDTINYNKLEITMRNAVELKDLKKSASTIAVQPTPTTWTVEIYQGHVAKVTKFKRSTIDNAPADALLFLSWYSGIRKVDPEILKIFHGLMSYVKLQDHFLVPDSLCAGEEDNVAVKHIYVDQTSNAWKFVNRNGMEAAAYVNQNLPNKFPIATDQCVEWIKWIHGLLTFTTDDKKPESLFLQ